jgi:hypothetical protein
MKEKLAKSMTIEKKVNLDLEEGICKLSYFLSSYFYSACDLYNQF